MTGNSAVSLFPQEVKVAKSDVQKSAESLQAVDGFVIARLKTAPQTKQGSISQS